MATTCIYISVRIHQGKTPVRNRPNVEKERKHPVTCIFYNQETADDHPPQQQTIRS
jgi:hypothetical protein